MGVFINIDAMTFFNAPTSEMTRETILRDVDFYTEKGGVEAVCFNMNFQRCYWRSHSREAVWDGCEFLPDGRVFYRGKEVLDLSPEPPMRRMVVNARALSENCPGFFELRYRRCRERGAEMWHSMRMNDVHWTPDPTHPQHNGLWQNRTDLWRAHFRRPYGWGWNNFGLDYGQEEVRDYNLALVREYFEHECDGIELDWMRSLPLFRPGMEEPLAPVLTGFVRQIRAAADEAAARFGHRVRIAHRVPATPDDALRSGMDVFTWAAEGLADVVIPTIPHAANNAVDTETDLWRRLLPAGTVLAPCLEWASTAFPGGPRLRSSAATDAGFAASFYHRGADTIYLYNHFRNNGGFDDPAELQEAFSFLGDKDRVYARPRRHITTYLETENSLEGRRGVRDLPDCAWGLSNVAFPFDVGGGTAGRKAFVLLGGDRPIDAEFRLNGVPCVRLPEPAPLPGTLPSYKGEIHYASYAVPAGVLHDGRNTADIINLDPRDFKPLWGEIWMP